MRCPVSSLFVLILISRLVCGAENGLFFGLVCCDVESVDHFNKFIIMVFRLM